jgi:hypothetical protein
MNKDKIFQHEVGEVVSTAIRFSLEKKFTNAVDSVKKATGLQCDCTTKPVACSFNLPDDKELLLQLQPADEGYATDCLIRYQLLDKTNAGLWIKYNWEKAGRRYQGVEGPGRSLPGVNDLKHGTRRTVLRDTEKNGARVTNRAAARDELDGYVINPPYPRLAAHTLKEPGNPINMGSAGLGFIALTTWILIRRRYLFG